MAVPTTAPWASGPGEILKHGLDLLARDSDTNRRLAMILIDNAVELTVKTYLGLPERITGLKVPRKELAEIGESFPALLAAIEKHAMKKLGGIDLATIEWFHRLRNELYHQGNGLTVERAHVEVYAHSANTLFKNLFGFPLVPSPAGSKRLLGEFIEAWVDLEAGLFSLAWDVSGLGVPRMNALQAARYLRESDIVSKADAREIEQMQKLKNRIVHATVNHRAALTQAVVDRVKALRDLYSEESDDS